MNNKKWLLVFKLGFAFSMLASVVFFIDIFSVSIQSVDTEFYRRITYALLFNIVICFFAPFTFCLFPKPLNAILFYLISAICILFTASSAFHFSIYGQLMGASSIFAVVDSNYAEAEEFLKFNSSIYSKLLPVIIVIVMTKWALFTKNLLDVYSSINNDHRLNLFALLIVVSLGTVGWSRLTFAFNNPITFVSQVGSDVITHRENFKKLASLKPANSNAKLLSNVKMPMTHLVIIGESATPSHMSLYGYERNTTPLLQRKRDYLQFIAEDVCSSKPLTQFSLADIMLAGKDFVVSDNGTAPPIFISSLNEVGYETFWISNQPGGAGVFNASSIWSEFASYSEFLNKRDFRLGFDFDEVLIPSVNKVLAKPNESKVIFIHLMGSHPDYSQRYPKQFKYWDSHSTIPSSVARRNEIDFNSDIYNAYDNSILYSDFVIASIVDMAEKHDVASIVYFSDHGQNVGENTKHIGHSLLDGPRQGYEVPLVLWINQSKTAQLDLNMESLKVNLTKPFSLENLQHTLFDLYGISQDKYKVEKSLFSKKLMPNVRVCDRLKNG